MLDDLGRREGFLNSNNVGQNREEGFENPYFCWKFLVDSLFFVQYWQSNILGEKIWVKRDLCGKRKYE